MNNLKPCPFCGCEARLMGGPEAQETYSVWCTNETGKRHSLDGLGYREEAAIAAWNTRASITPQEAAKVLLSALGPEDLIEERIVDMLFDGEPFSALRAIAEEGQ